MAEEREKKRKSRSMMSFYFASQMRRTFYGFMRGVRSVLGIIVIVILIYLLLSGAINQVKTGETMVNYFLHIGQNLGETLESLFTSDSPFKITEDGIYFQDAEIPDNGALDDSIFDKPQVEDKEYNNQNETELNNNEDLNEGD